MSQFNLLNHIIDDDESIVVWLYNIGIEKYWFKEIPSIQSQNDNHIVNHMEEMNLLITRKQDYIILRKRPNQDFFAKLEKIGAQIPNIIVPSFENESVSISEIVLEDAEVQTKLQKIRNKFEKVYLVPYGVSENEERIAAMFDFELIGGPCKIAQILNNKVNARGIAQSLGFMLTEGTVCNSFGELERACKELLEKYNKIVLKIPTGASGNGVWFVEKKKVNVVLQLIKKVCALNNLDEVFIVEKWYEDRKDINYQIYISKDGTINVFSVKYQIVDKAIYKGSILLTDSTQEINRECIECGELIGKKLYELGYNGIVGIDAMIVDEGVFIPIIEINARFTLSTYTSFIKEKGNGVIFSGYKRVRLGELDDYKNIVAKLNEYYGNDTVLCYVAATLEYLTVGKYGRLFIILFGASVDEIIRRYESISDIFSAERE